MIARNHARVRDSQNETHLKRLLQLGQQIDSGIIDEAALQT